MWMSLLLCSSVEILFTFLTTVSVFLAFFSPKRDFEVLARLGLLSPCVFFSGFSFMQCTTCIEL